MFAYVRTSDPIQLFSILSTCGHQLFYTFQASANTPYVITGERNSCGSCVWHYRENDLAWRTRRMSDRTLVLWWYSPISLRGWQARISACKAVTLNSMTCLPCLSVIVWSRSSFFYNILVKAKASQGLLLLDSSSRIQHLVLPQRIILGVAEILCAVWYLHGSFV
jgi:hypothetical protein